MRARKSLAASLYAPSHVWLTCSALFSPSARDYGPFVPISQSCLSLPALTLSLKAIISCVPLLVTFTPVARRIFMARRVLFYSRKLSHFTRPLKFCPELCDGSVSDEREKKFRVSGIFWKLGSSGSERHACVVFVEIFKLTGVLPFTQGFFSISYPYPLPLPG